MEQTVASEKLDLKWRWTCRYLIGIKMSLLTPSDRSDQCNLTMKKDHSFVANLILVHPQW